MNPKRAAKVGINVQRSGLELESNFKLSHGLPK